MENSSNISSLIIETINTIFHNLFSSIDTNLYDILDEKKFSDALIAFWEYLE